MSKRITYIHQYYKTPEEGGAVRSYYISQALADAGYIVTIITSHNKDEYITQKDGNITIHYLPVQYHQGMSFFRRICAFVHFIFRSVQVARSIPSDICIATSTPLTVGVIALFLKWTKKIPYIFEVRDLWPLAPIQMKIINNPILILFLTWLEKKIYKGALHIVALSPDMADHIRKIAPEIPLSIIPNMSDVDFFELKLKPIEDTFHIVYTGSIGKANKIENLIDWISEWIKVTDKDIMCTIMGDGSEKIRLMKVAADLPIVWKPMKNKMGVKELLESADACFVSFDQFPVLDSCSPNKWFDALASGKPTLSTLKGWTAILTKQYNCGILVSPQNNKESISELYSLIQDPPKWELYQVRARKLALEAFDKRTLTANYVQLIMSIG